MIIGGIERSAKWVDENWMKIASDPTLEILEFIQKKMHRMPQFRIRPTRSGTNMQTMAVLLQYTEKNR